MRHWSQRVRPQPPAIAPEVQQVRNAAIDIAQQAHHAPGRAGTAFRTVADCALIGTAVISGALASLHLWKALFPKPHDDRRGRPGEGREPQPQDSGKDRPPRRHLTIAAGHGRGRD
jgi:hypothetical protein